MFSDERSVDQKKLNIAIKISNLEEKINSIKDGINSLVGVDGLSLSGGERQKIAIARSLYQNKSILILDESTNALDEDTEKKILDNIWKNFKNKTIIQVTHNPKILSKFSSLSI